MADATISAAGLRIIKLLVGNPPQSISDLIDALAVTRTAVTEQLYDLERAGFVEHEAKHLAGRGRPQYLYRATDAALLLLFVQHQCLVVPAIWRSLEELGGEELWEKVLNKVSRLLAEHYLPKITAKKPEERLRQLMHLFNSEGGLTEVLVNDGRMTLQKRTCPFISMVDEKRSICSVDLEMMGHIVGKPVVRTSCRHDGDPCCTFEIANGK